MLLVLVHSTYDHHSVQRHSNRITQTDQWGDSYLGNVEYSFVLLIASFVPLFSLVIFFWFPPPPPPPPPRSPCLSSVVSTQWTKSVRSYISVEIWEITHSDIFTWRRCCPLRRDPSPSPFLPRDIYRPFLVCQCLFVCVCTISGYSAYELRACFRVSVC